MEFVAIERYIGSIKTAHIGKLTGIEPATENAKSNGVHPIQLMQQNWFGWFIMIGWELITNTVALELVTTPTELLITTL